MIGLYVEIPIWIVLAVALFFVFPPAVLISIVGLAISVILHLVWKAERARRRRERATQKAAALLPKSEALEYGNRVGRYASPNAIPSNFPYKLMNKEERYRYHNRLGEFS